MNTDWSASKIASGLKNTERRQKLAKLLLSLDEPMAYSNADHEIKSAIFAVLEEAAVDGTKHLKRMYGDLVV